MKTRHARAQAQNRQVAALVGTVSEDVWQEVFLFLEPHETMAPARAAKALNNAARRDGLWSAFAARDEPDLWCAIGGSGRERFRRVTMLEFCGDINFEPHGPDFREDLDCELTVVVTVTQATGDIDKGGGDVVFLARFPYVPATDPYGIDPDMISLEIGTENEHGMKCLTNTPTVPEIKVPFTALPGEEYNISPIPDPELYITWMFETPDGRVAKLLTMVAMDMKSRDCVSDWNNPYFALSTWYRRTINLENPMWRFEIDLCVTFPMGPDPTGLVADIQLRAANWEKGEYARTRDSEELAANFDQRVENVVPAFRDILSRLEWL